VERDVAAALRERIERGQLVVPPERLTSVAPVEKVLIPVADAPPDTPFVAAVRHDRSCAFYERASGLCAIHRQAGPDLLPVACRQFPRIALVDDRGLFVAVSHYCPTAAALLFRDDCALAIVESPSAFPADFPYDPFDARDGLPPLLSPTVLIDLDTYGRWEREVAGIFARGDLRPEAAVSAVVRLAEALRTWRPGKQSLVSHFHEVLERTAPGPCSTGQRALDLERHYETVLASIPESHRPVVPVERARPAYEKWVAEPWQSFARPVSRYLAAKAFGCWLAYQGRGLRTIAHSLVVALSVLKVNAALACDAAGRPLTRETLTSAIRETDHMLVHLASWQALATALSEVEKVAGRLSSDVR
jgi:hypothetical protein